jgi:hypothetical protein
LNARWLYYLVHGKKPPRKAGRSRRRGPARDWKYRAWIRTLPSIVSGKPGCEACHTGSDGGMSMKASDSTVVPLTRAEHREYDADRRAFERKYGVSMRDMVRELNQVWKLRKENAA